IANRLHGELYDYQETVDLPGGKVVLTLGPSKTLNQELEEAPGGKVTAGKVTFSLQGEPLAPGAAGKTEPHLSVGARYGLGKGGWAFASATYALSDGLLPEGKEGPAQPLNGAAFPRLAEQLAAAAPGGSPS